MMISTAVHGGLLKGFNVGNTTFSHLLFVDDMLNFSSAMPGQLCYLLTVFLLFEVASGLKVNLAKSVLIPVGSVSWYFRMWGCYFANKVPWSSVGSLL